MSEGPGSSAVGRRLLPDETGLVVVDRLIVERGEDDKAGRVLDRLAPLWGRDNLGPRRAGGDEPDDQHDERGDDVSVRLSGREPGGRDRS